METKTTGMMAGTVPGTGIAMAVLDLCRLLAPQVDPDVIRARLHAVAQMARTALDLGATAADLLDVLRVATAPPPPEPPAPWTDYLRLSLEEFIGTGASMRVFIPESGWTLWLGDGPAGKLAAAGVWSAVVKDQEWMHRQLEEAGVPATERTVEKLVEVLRARVEGWVPPTAPVGAAP